MAHRKPNSYKISGFYHCGRWLHHHQSHEVFTCDSTTQWNSLKLRRLHSSCFKSYCFLNDKSLFLRHYSYKTKQVFIRSSYYCYCEKPICTRCSVTQLARESVGLCPFRSSYVREFKLSHNYLVNRAGLFEAGLR